jgi:hypothetical protein
MATLESDKVHTALTNKLHCEVDTSKRDHNWYVVRDGGQVLATTQMSKGSKETLRETLCMLMARQLKIGGAGNLVKFVSCTLSKEECLVIIRAASGVKKPVESASQPAPAARMTEKKKPSGKG